MANIKESALVYEPQQTKNIAEMEYVSVDLELTESTNKNSDGEEFKVKTITVDGEKYRIPNSVLEQLKNIIQKFPDTGFFCVTKKGTGMGTSYQVLPHNGKPQVEEIK